MIAKQLSIFVMLLLISHSGTNFINGCIKDPNLLTTLLTKCYEYVSLRKNITLFGALESIAMNYEVWCLLILEIDKVKEIVKNPECAAWLTASDTCQGNDPNIPQPSVSFPIILPFVPTASLAPNSSPTVVLPPNIPPAVTPTVFAVPGVPITVNSPPPAPPPSMNTAPGMAPTIIAGTSPLPASTPTILTSTPPPSPPP